MCAGSFSKGLHFVGIGCSLLLFFSLPAFSQGETGRILGSVHDQSGGAISGASVTVTDVQRGIARALTTDDAGEYAAPNLVPGSYTVHAEYKGFKAAERQNLLLEVGKELRVDLTLQPGEQTQTITVTESLPMVDTTNAVLGGTLSNQVINDLPLSGRDYENLLQLRPGVIRNPGGGVSAFSTNGLRPEQNVWMLEGLNNMEPFSAQAIVAADAATILPIDAIQEFATQENPKAEYGWKPGAVVNVGLKSGTNSVHGTAFAFGRDAAWDARNFFDSPSYGSCKPTAAGCAQTALALEQFGATIGAPLVKDKIFLFTAYEGQRWIIGNNLLTNSPSTIGLPTPATPTCTGAGVTGDCANSVPNALADLAAHGVAESALSGKLLGLFAPNTTNSIGLNPGFPNTNREDTGAVKVDYHINDRHNLSGMYIGADGAGIQADAAYQQQQFLSIVVSRAQAAGATWNWTPNTRWVNEARFGWERLNHFMYTGDHTTPANGTAYPINTGITNPLYFGLPQIRVSGFSTLGGGNWPKLQGPDTVLQFLDQLSYLVGKHTFKFGGEIRGNTFNGAAYSGARGTINFGTQGQNIFNGATPLEDFLAGFPSAGSLLVGNPGRTVTNQGYALFLQDDWRMTPRLTVNLGVRYELNTVLKERNNLFANFDPVNGLEQVGNGLLTPYNGDHNNFAPRMGFAWDVRGNGRTVVRGGGGIWYDTLSFNVFLAVNNRLGLNSIPTGAQLETAPGVFTQGPGSIAVASTTLTGGTGSSLVTNWLNNSPSTPLFAGGAVQCGNNQIGQPGNSKAVQPAPCTILAVNPNLRSPYVGEWNLGIQHAFTNNLSIDLSYVGNKGTKLTGLTDINQPLPHVVNVGGTNYTVGAGWTTLPGGAGTLDKCLAGAACKADTAAEQAARPFYGQFPYLGQIEQMSNLYGSNYNGMQVAVSERASHGLSFVAGYTYSHALDFASLNYGGGLPQDSTNTRAQYGNANWDIRNRFTFSTTYNLPGIKSPAQLLQGWQLTSIVTLQSGEPWGATDASHDFSGTGELVDRWDFIGNPQDFRSTQFPTPYFPGTTNANCKTAAAAMGPLGTAALAKAGCYAVGSSMLLPPPVGTFGTMGRNIFRDPGFRNWDVSVVKNIKIKERLSAQFRAEFFNVLNHPIFASPYGGPNGQGLTDPSTPGAIAGNVVASGFGCGCTTPDQATGEPVTGTGGARALQLGLKLIF